VFRGLYSKLARGGGESLFCRAAAAAAAAVDCDDDDDDEAAMGIGWDMAWIEAFLMAVRELDNNQLLAVTSLK